MQKKINRFLLSFLTIFCLLNTSNIFAKAVLDIVPNSIIANLTMAGLATVTYTVTNDTKHPINQLIIDIGYQTKGYPAGIQLINNHCAKVTLTPNQSCTFQAMLTGSIYHPALFILRPRVCGYNGAVCSVPIAANEVKVVAAPAISYITNVGTNTVSVCLVNADATLGSCTQLSDPSFAGPAGVTTNTFVTFIYVANNTNNSISVCPIIDNELLGPCTAVFAPSLFIGPTSVTSNLVGSYIYVANYNDDSVTVCSMNTNGTITNCKDSGQVFTQPNTIRINTMGTFAYVTNHSVNTVSVCPVNTDGTLGTCNTSDPGSTFHHPTGITLNTMNTFAYVSNSQNVGGNRNVSVCSLNANGSLGTCTEFISPLFNGNNFGKLAVNSGSTFLYVVNENNNYISLCSLNANGSIASCSRLTPPNTTFNNPEGIIIG